MDKYGLAPVWDRFLAEALREPVEHVEHYWLAHADGFESMQTERETPSLSKQ